MVEAENYSRTKTPLEVQLIPILGQEFQPCIQYNFLSTGVISMVDAVEELNQARGVYSFQRICYLSQKKTKSNQFLGRKLRVMQ